MMRRLRGLDTQSKLYLCVSLFLAAKPVQTSYKVVLKLGSPEPVQLVIPPKPNYNDILSKLKADQDAGALVAKKVALEASEKVAIIVVPVTNSPSEPSGGAATAQDEPQALGFIGSVGYSLPYGNCVDIAHEYGKNQPGDPITWIPTTQTPAVGDAALFYFNHVGIITGIHSDGTIEIAQANAPGMPHRFPPSEFRFF
jgi:hypothetical protein